MTAQPTSSSAPDWLTTRPIAHRGLHDIAVGIVENSPSAADAAVEAGYAIECDVQLTLDEDAVVFHDFDLDRLTSETGTIASRTSKDVQSIAYRTGSDTIMSLSTLLARLAGRMPLICEIKSRFDGDVRLADRVMSLVRRYNGPVAIKSFDPAVIAHLRGQSPAPLGIVAEARYDDPEWSGLSDGLKLELEQMLHFGETRPDFLSYRVGDLPHAVPYLCRTALGMPVMTWTVRRPDQHLLSRLWADQIVFEGFRP
ncbi:glycerophosphodiester phosphodiesterase family protein [Lichenihabitans psoromatis]|uniref:glycerophosphodiester phosphodiesterase family protein n=1 Tax=Lichenihabitans psoromatis TaxID=2528642 RepID=UPI0010384A95|nr:glycerophosphodiester phosphodiesterase family protein [Lichenihabitans psoromatis]